MTKPRNAVLLDLERVTETFCAWGHTHDFHDRERAKHMREKHRPDAVRFVEIYARLTAATEDA